MPSPPPSASNDYTAGTDTPLTAATWNAVLNDISARLKAAEAIRASFQALIDLGTGQALISIADNVGPLIAAAQAQIAALNADIALLQSQFELISTGGVDAGTFTAPGVAVFLYRSTTPGAAPASLHSGQFAINEADGKVFWLDADGVTVKSAILPNIAVALADAIAAAAAAAAAVQPGNNLSDLVSVKTARATLGIEVATGHGDSDYAILATDRFVYTNAAFTAPRSWALPAANAVNPNAPIIVADLQGTVTGTNTLTVPRLGSDTVNGGTSVVLDVAYGMIEFWSDGVSKWFAHRKAPYGTAANQDLRLDNAAKIPAVDGSQITNLVNYRQIGSPITLSGSSVAITSLAASDLIAIFTSITYSTSALMQAALSTDNGSTYGTAQNVTVGSGAGPSSLAALAVLYTGLKIGSGKFFGDSGDSAFSYGVSSASGGGAGVLSGGFNKGAPVTAIKFAPSAGTFTGGTLTLYGR